jgi:hypothetical protein
LDTSLSDSREASTSVPAEGGPMLVNIPRTTEVRETPGYYAALTFFRKKKTWVWVFNLLLWFAAGCRIWETAVCAVIHFGWTNNQARFLQRTTVTIDGTAPQPRFRAWIHVPWFPIQTFVTLEQPKVGGCSELLQYHVSVYSWYRISFVSLLSL